MPDDINERGAIVHGFGADGSLSHGARIALTRWWNEHMGSVATLPVPAPDPNATTTTTTSTDGANGTSTSTPITSAALDSPTSANISDPQSQTRSALDSWVTGKGYATGTPTLDPGAVDGIVEGLARSATSKTYTAIATLVSRYAPATPAPDSSGGSGASPRFFVEKFRSGSMTDDDVVRSAIRAAATFSATYEHPTVEFGARVYDVTHGVFSDLGTVVQVGMTFVGQGYSTLRLKTGGQAGKWFYDNGSSAGSAGNDDKDHRRLAFAKFENLNFITDDPTRTNGNGFRLTGIGLAHEQNFMFEHCRFFGMNEVLRADGNLNTDSIRLYDCYGYDNNTVMVLNNNQAVLMEWFGTSFELVRKSAFRIESGGGGDVKIYGGSYVMEKASGDSGTYALVDAAATDNTAWGNGNLLFSGIKTELRDADTMLARLPGMSGAIYAHFDSCNLHTANAAAHDMLTLGVNRRVTFTNCQLPEGGRYVFDLGYEAQSLPAPILRFEHCETPEDLPAMVRWKNAKFGTAHGKGNKAINPQSPFSTAYLNDFDLNVLTGGLRSATAERKIATFFPTGLYAWPNADSTTVQEWNLVLPPGALVTRIVINRPALTGGSTTPYVLTVSNGNKTGQYANTSASGTYSGAVALDVAPNATIPNDPANIVGRTLKLYASKTGDASPAAFGVGLAFIEYI